MTPYQERVLAELRGLGQLLQDAAVRGAGAPVLDPLLASMRELDDGIRTHLAAELGAHQPPVPPTPTPLRARRRAERCRLQNPTTQES
ncbi:hypothetical protein OG455_30560 [Kitasatospora sp. NBC_01287]|uniref:hypothetical protein n=1 Tax=Kitasatospora sp. NBC_01287 TaxID=2903573 RepID=UPI00225AF80A|nr:hypothetical protein [Kitasatospora sp. NBC_01287]MCX4749807.1 hypothetical protein [Kitasatospora sp. NBC_01287]